MRPLAIWGMQYAWNNIVPEDSKNQYGLGLMKTYEESAGDRLLSHQSENPLVVKSERYVKDLRLHRWI